MKNRAKMISLLMAVCMMITMLPAVAMAANGTKSVNIGTVTLNASKPYYHNGVSGAQGTADNDPTAANAIFDASSGTLTLNNLHIVNTTSGKKGIQWTYSGSGANDLIIVLPAGTTNIVENTQGAAINGEYGWQTADGGGSLTVTGSGELKVTGSSFGIWVWHNIVFEGNVKVNVTGTSKTAIANNNYHGKILIKDNAQVTAVGGTYAIGYDNNHDNIPEIQSGMITAIGGTAAFMKHPNPIGAAVNTGTIHVNSDSNDVGATVWDGAAPFTGYKYVGITSTPVTTYTATYHSNNGEDAQFQQIFSAGIQQNLKDNRFENSTYDFMGWNTADDGSGTPYADKAAVTLTSNVDLYAQWDGGSTAPATYTVTYDPNGGSGTMVAGSVSSSSGHYVFPANGFTAPDGKQFKCWNMGGTNYNVGDAINVSSDITVKAVWEDIPTGGNTDPGTTIPTVDASSGISLWYNGGNSFGSSKSAVPTSVEIDGVPVVFNGTGSEFTVGCISPNAKWITVRWNSTSVTTNFTPDANAFCNEISLPKTGDVSVMAFALMAVIAAAGAMGKK